MAEAPVVTRKPRGAAGSAYEAKLTAPASAAAVPAVKTAPPVPVTALAAPAIKAAPPAPATAIAAPVSTEARILANLNEGWKNAKDKFVDRSTFDASYDYATKTPAQRAVLDSFWSSKKGSASAPSVATAPVVPGAGNLTAPALNVVDKQSQDAFKLPAVAAAEKAGQLLEDQDEFNKKVLANLEASTSPILAQTREQYKQFADLIAQTKSTYAEKIAGLKDLRANQDQEIDINKGGQIQAMRASMAAKGITGEAAEAAIAQASYDPKYIKAATDVKKQYLLDITGASDKLGEIITGLVNNQTSLTAAESSILQSIRAKKEELDKAVKDIKASATESSYKPVEDYAKSKTDAAQANDATNYDVRSEQALWLKSDEPTKIATLQRKLFSESGGAAERGLVTNDDYAKAAKMGSFTEGQAYLESIIASKKQSNAVGLTSAANPSPSVTQPVGQFSAEKVNSVLSAYASGTPEQRKQIIEAMNKSGMATEAEKAFFKSQFSAIDAKASPAPASSDTAPATKPADEKADAVTDKNQQKALDDAHYVERKLAEPAAIKAYEAYNSYDSATKALMLSRFKDYLAQGKLTQVQYDAFMEKIKAGNAK